MLCDLTKANDDKITSCEEGETVLYFFFRVNQYMALFTP